MIGRTTKVFPPPTTITTVVDVAVRPGGLSYLTRGHTERRQGPWVVSFRVRHVSDALLRLPRAGTEQERERERERERESWKGEQQRVWL